MYYIYTMYVTHIKQLWHAACMPCGHHPFVLDLPRSMETVNATAKLTPQLTPSPEEVHRTKARIFDGHVELKGLLFDWTA